MFGHIGTPQYTEPRYIPEEPARPDEVIFFASYRMADPEHAAELARPYDVFAVSALDPEEWSAFRVQLHRRGMLLVEEEGEMYIHPAASCLYCREEHGAGMHEVCEGATPEEEVDQDGEVTGAMCRICFKALLGPPFPFCCTGRARLIQKIEGPGPFKACSACHGQGCVVCSGTGVAGVL